MRVSGVGADTAGFGAIGLGLGSGVGLLPKDHEALPVASPLATPPSPRPECKW
jgi:hypothetical protein